jgi:uncharacterized delta-60 repeat protein
VSKRRSAPVALAALVAALLAAAPVRAASLDPGFGDQGRVVLDFGGMTSAVAGGVAIQPDGRIVAGGWIGGSFGLVRLLPDGALDPSFGTGGIARLGFGAEGPGHNVPALAIQQDGKFVIAGSVHGSGGLDFALARVNPDGSLDPSFGNAGTLDTPVAPGGADDVANDVAVRPDGRILAVGAADGPAGGDFAAARYLGDGRLDPSFGTGGIATVPMAPDTPGDSAAAVALDADGRAVLAGTTIQPDTSFDIAALRLTAAGAADPSFGGDGWSRFAPDGDAWQGVKDVAVLPDGGSLVAGWSFRTTYAHPQIAVVRMLPDGSPDPSFGTDGVVLTAVGDTQDMAGGLLQSGMTTYVAIDSRGAEPDESGGSVYARKMGVLALDAAGNRDASFAPDGALLFHMTFLGDDRAAGIAQSGTGSLIMVATVRSTSSGLDTLGLAAIAPQSSAPITPPPVEITPPPEQRVAPTSEILVPRSGGRVRPLSVLRGTATGPLGVERVDVALVRLVGRAKASRSRSSCAYLRSRRGSFKRESTRNGRCRRLVWLRATGSTAWRYTLREPLPAGRFVLYSRATAAGLVEAQGLASSGTANRVAFTLKARRPR